MRRGVKRRTPDRPCYVCGGVLRYKSGTECIDCKKKRAANRYNEQIEGKYREKVLFYYTSGVSVPEIALHMRRSAYRIKECLINAGLMDPKLLNERLYR